jgi:hypothetical protein
VASSRIKMRGSARIARAIDTRWRWPPVSLTPRSPMVVSYFSESAPRTHRRERRGRRPRICSSVAPGRENATFSRIVPSNRTTPAARRPIAAIGFEPHRGEIHAVHENRPGRARETRRRARSSWTCPIPRSRRARSPFPRRPEAIS